MFMNTIILNFYYFIYYLLLNHYFGSVKCTSFNIFNILISVLSFAYYFIVTVPLFFSHSLTNPANPMLLKCIFTISSFSLKSCLTLLSIILQLAGDTI